MQRRHPIRHLLWRGGVAAIGNAMMFTGLYPLLPHALRLAQRGDAVGDQAYDTSTGAPPVNRSSDTV